MTLAPSMILVGRSFRAGLSFLFRAVPASLLGTLALLSVAIQELVGRSRGRPLGLFPIATGLAPGVGGVADAVATLGFLGLGERKTPGLVRGLSNLDAPAPGGSRSRTLTSGGSYCRLFSLRVDGGSS